MGSGKLQVPRFGEFVYLIGIKGQASSLMVSYVFQETWLAGQLYMEA